MTTKQIEAAQMKANTKFEVAKAIRKLLDEARKSYGPTEWDDESLESEIIELVTAEG